MPMSWHTMMEFEPPLVGCGNSRGRRVDKWQRFGLTALPGKVVDAPLIAECYASLECAVADTRLMNRYNFFVLEVKKAWVDPTCKAPRTLHHRGHGVFSVAGETIRLPSNKKWAASIEKRKRAPLP